MVSFPLVKNHGDASGSRTAGLETVLSSGHINSVIYSDPFLKAGFISRLVGETKLHVLYIDLDLLYSGYLASETIQAPANLTLYQPAENTIAQMLTDVITRASKSQVLIIIDSINGLFNTLNYEKQVGKSVASIVMLLASFAAQTKSYVVIASMARYKREEGWVLSPSGKRLIETRNSRRILLEPGQGGIVASPQDGQDKIFLPAGSIPL